MRLPAVLIILDGWGLAPDGEGNAITRAGLTVFPRLWEEYPHATLHASGEEVGLPARNIGNSEVGHTCIGAGRIVAQDLTRIDAAIADGTFFENPVLRACMEKARAGGGRLHLMGRLSDGGVHSHRRHVRALVKMAGVVGVPALFLHLFTDGRDTDPKSGRGFVEALEETLQDEGIGQIASVQGRFYAMDRDHRWERTEKAYRALVLGEGERVVSAAAAVQSAYHRGETDEFIVPSVVDGVPGQIRDGDAMIFFNFRADRARQLTRALNAPDFAEFPVEPRTLVAYVCMTEYHRDFPFPVAFPPLTPERTFGELVAERGIPQTRIAETEKYAHVTFFFSGGREAEFAGEERILVPSPQVRTYDLQPEMSARAVTDRALAALEREPRQVLVLNFANPDMVGHTGNFPAAVRAVQTVDELLGELVPAVTDRDGFLIITADHGNVEQMINPDTGSPHTAHTTNPVPLILVDPRRRGAALRPSGSLADVIPTLMAAMELTPPPEMAGHSLLVGG